MKRKIIALVFLFLLVSVSFVAQPAVAGYCEDALRSCVRQCYEIFIDPLMEFGCEVGCAIGYNMC